MCTAFKRDNGEIVLRYAGCEACSERKCDALTFGVTVSDADELDDLEFVRWEDLLLN